MPDHPRTRAAAIDVERSAGVTVRFEDGHECRFSLIELRANCPCATCRARRDRDDEPLPPATIAGAELAGNWGLQLTWDDGHATGIFPWDALRQWCDERDAP